MALQLVPPFFNVVRLAAGRAEPSGQLSLLWLMATACEKDLPLDSAVEAMANAATGSWRFMLEDLASMLRRGMPLEEAVPTIPKLLPPEAVLAIKVGAANDALGPALRAEAERMAWMQESSGAESIGGALLYLCGLGAIMLAALSFIMIYIIPKYRKIFDDFGVELPPVTNTLINIVQPNILVVLGPLCVGLLVFPLFWLLWSMGVRFRWFSLRRFYPRLDIGPVLRQLSVVVGCGQPLIDGLHIVSTQHPNTSTWRRLSEVYESVKVGETCWESMQFHRLLKPRERYLLESAERLGNLPWALDLLGRQIEDRQDNAMRTALQLIRPWCLAMIGIAVGFIAIALFMPLIKLVSDLS